MRATALIVTASGCRTSRISATAMATRVKRSALLLSGVQWTKSGGSMGTHAAFPGDTSRPEPSPARVRSLAGGSYGGRMTKTRSTTTNSPWLSLVHAVSAVFGGLPVTALGVSLWSTPDDPGIFKLFGTGIAALGVVELILGGALLVLWVRTRREERRVEAS